MPEATQAYSAMQRISAFLGRIEMIDSKPHDRSSVPLKLRDASFEIMGPDKKALFRVGTFSFEVHCGEVVAVCGPVGSGKSTLINGLIGEVSRTADSVVERSEHVGYARQNAFIVNATVRDNILLGKNFDKTLYDKVIESCCLQTDLDLLGPARDLTEIGERGVTLSGGKATKIIFCGTNLVAYIQQVRNNE
jgi:ABC-type transport system involved in cytochrome bd biosynthesis fused ATPase/permease subunit